MRYPTTDQVDGAAARRVAPDFDLTQRALRFAQLYAENPRLGATHCAIQAGYARRCVSGAHVRAYELLRDPRVIQAIIHYAGKALNEAMAEARQNLARLAIKEGRLWNGWDRNAFNRLTAKLNKLDVHVERLEDIYTKGISPL